MLDLEQRSIPRELEPLHILARAGLSSSGIIRRSSVVDISKLLESRDSAPPAGTEHALSSALDSTTRTRSSSSLRSPKQLSSGPVLPPYSLISGTLSSAPPSSSQGGRSPPSLPPLASLQPSPDLHSAPHPQQQGQSYHSTPPSRPGFPPFSPRNLPSLSSTLAPHPTSISSGPLAPSMSFGQSSGSNKRSADSSYQSAPSKKKHHGKWTEEEDNLAIELRRRGMKWDDIAKRIPGRSAISCRLRYQNYSEKRPNWDEEKKNKLARLYNRFKREMWEMVATEMGLPWRAVESMHWQMGQEEMASRANVPVFQPSGSGGPQSPEAEYMMLDDEQRRRSSSTLSRRQHEYTGSMSEQGSSQYPYEPKHPMVPPFTSPTSNERISQTPLGSITTHDTVSPYETHRPYTTPSPPVVGQRLGSIAGDLTPHQRSDSGSSARSRETLPPPPPPLTQMIHQQDAHHQHQPPHHYQRQYSHPSHPQPVPGRPEGEIPPPAFRRPS